MLSKISKQYAFAYLNNKAALTKVLQGSRFQLSNAGFHTMTASRGTQALMNIHFRSMATDALDNDYES